MGYSCSFIKYDLKLDNSKKLVGHFFMHNTKIFFAAGEQMLTILMYSEP